MVNFKLLSRDPTGIADKLVPSFHYMIAKFRDLDLFGLASEATFLRKFTLFYPCAHMFVQ